MSEKDGKRMKLPIAVDWENMQTFLETDLQMGGSLTAALLINLFNRPQEEVERTLRLISGRLDEFDASLRPDHPADPYALKGLAGTYQLTQEAGAAFAKTPEAHRQAIWNLRVAMQRILDAENPDP